MYLIQFKYYTITIYLRAITAVVFGWGYKQITDNQISTGTIVLQKTGKYKIPYQGNLNGYYWRRSFVIRKSMIDILNGYQDIGAQQSMYGKDDFKFNIIVVTLYHDQILIHRLIELGIAGYWQKGKCLEIPAER